VEAHQVNKRPIQVRISSDGELIVTVKQRDLFGKYGWPAESEITEALTRWKENNTKA
jgi:hypothetical protein